MKFSFFSFKNKKELKKCAWCGKESSALPFSKTKKGKTYWFCSRECQRAFRIQFNKLMKKTTCSTCLLKKIKK